jgi:enamine deaminase RidA (YjgF/YER057c/UK114 family)
MKGGTTVERQNVSSGSPYEPQIGISRAVRIDNIVAVSGTAPLGVDGKTVHVGDLYHQTERCLEIIVEAVIKAGARKEDIIRTRVYLTDISQWQDAAQAHGEFFSEIRPACTFLQVSRFVQPDWLVEVEADCVLLGST